MSKTYICVCIGRTRSLASEETPPLRHIILSVFRSFVTAKYCKILANAKIVAEHPDHPTNLFKFSTLDSACSASWARMLWRSARIRPRSRATATATRRESPAVKTDRVAQSLTTHHTLVKFGSANISIGIVLITHQGIQWRLFAKGALGRIGSQAQ